MSKLLLPLAGALFAGAALVPAAAGAGTATTATTPVPECTSGDLAASFHVTGAGMSHVYGVVRVRNVSAGPCVVQGYGGLSYVGDGNGTQIGRPAGRTPSATPRIVLAPGRRAASWVEMTETAPYPRKVCRPHSVDGFRLYVPDSTTAKFLPHPTSACSNRRLRTLWHQAFQPVR